MLGVPFTGRTALPGEPVGDGQCVGDKCLSIIDLARATQQPLEDVWRAIGEDLQWYTLKLVKDTIARYKADTGKVDFGDMLSIALRQKLILPVDIAIIDEAQDNTKAQWSVLRCLFRKAKLVIIAGDDDQAIHSWAGADIRHFLSIRAEREVLPKSHRLPTPVWEVGARVASRIAQRIPKDWRAADHAGSVQHVPSIDSVDINTGTGGWMLLVRSHHQVPALEKDLRARGVLYSTQRGPSVYPAHVSAIVAWERRRGGRECSESDEQRYAPLVDPRIPSSAPWFDAFVGVDQEQRAYYRSVLRNGTKLTDKPQVYIGTIHSVKGKEAENVVLFTDMTERIARSHDSEPDTEHRVFYVGATRARRNLYIVDPEGPLGYRV